MAFDTVLSDKIKAARAWRLAYDQRPYVRVKRREYLRRPEVRAKSVERNRRWERANADKLRLKRRNHFIKNVEWLADLKDRRCQDCNGFFHHSQMEFDHRPGSLKYFSIGARKLGKRETLLSEINKCDLVCANCHALRTWVRHQVSKRQRSTDGL